MKPYRWGKTMNAYTKWAFIFDKELPIEIETEQAALSVATYLRDTIAFAHENSLKGADWYKKVMITATGSHKLVIRMRKNYAKVNTYPTKSVFELLDMHQKGQLKVGYKFFTTDSVDEVIEMLKDLGVNYYDCGSNLMEIVE